MKKYLFVSLILANAIALVVTAADINYQKAVQSAASFSSDSEFEKAMSEHGFTEDWSHEYTTIEKVKVLLKVN